jgi:hypothetical protein
MGGNHSNLFIIDFIRGRERRRRENNFLFSQEAKGVVRIN